jgi:hypothetical protein
VREGKRKRGIERRDEFILYVKIIFDERVFPAGSISWNAIRNNSKKDVAVHTSPVRARVSAVNA